VCYCFLLETKTKNIDTFFASYLPENEKYSNEVATIAYKLGTMGYKVTALNTGMYQ